MTTTHTTWYEAALVYLRALDIPLGLGDELARLRALGRRPFGIGWGEAWREYVRAVDTWIAERRAAREVGG